MKRPSTPPCSGPSREQLRSPRVLQRLHHIQETACTLVVERGYDGFTMDELAEAVGVSRRTLFNYVADKASAVVGPFEPGGAHGREILDTFRAGGPTGDLTTDLHRSIDAVIDEADDLGGKRPGHHHILEAAIAADPKVRGIVTERFEQVTTMLEDAVVEREGWPEGDLRARTLAATTLALIQVTLGELKDHASPDASDFRTTFHQVIDAHTAVRVTA